MSFVIVYSDDEGVSWLTGKVDPSASTPLDLIRSGDSGPFFALRDHTTGGITTSILRSVDGQAWEAVEDPMKAIGVDAIPSSLAYAFKPDTLYISYQDSFVIFALLRASQVDIAAANAALLASDPVVTLLKGVSGYWRPILSPSSFGRGPRTLVSQKLGAP